MTAHDLTAAWHECGECARLRAAYDKESAGLDDAVSRIDDVWGAYRRASERGEAYVYTAAWDEWHRRIATAERRADMQRTVVRDALRAWTDGMHEHMDDADDVDEACTDDIGDTDEACPDLGGYTDPCAWCRCRERRDHARGGYVRGDDAPERARRREELRRRVGRLMGVGPDEVNIICSGVFEIGGDRDGHA